MHRLLITYLIFLSFLSVALGQTSYGVVQFHHIDIAEAVAKAEAEGKKIFIDTYAPWCIPCKKMDPIFRDRDVAAFFNEHFINVKVNMDRHVGKDIAARYHIAFLPTLVFAEADGKMRLSVDRVLNKHELLAFANTALSEPQRNPVAQSRPVKKVEHNTVRRSNKKLSETTSSSQKQSETIVAAEPEKAEEKILMIFDKEKQSTDPQQYFQEAYFRMQLMDGSHWESAKAYLATQDDWSTEKNMRFIFDFVKSTQTPEFEYILSNRSKFNALFTEFQIDRTIEILVYTRLNQGYPRPELEEARELFKAAKVINPNLRAYKYIIKRKLDESDDSDILEYIDNYLQIDGYTDAKMLNLYGEYAAKTMSKRKDLSIAKKYVEEALVQQPNNPQYHMTLAKIYYRLENKVKATMHTKRTMELSQNQEQLSEESTELMKKIKTL